MDSAEVKSKGKRVPTESSRKLSTEVNSSSSSSPQVKVFYCYFCDYSNSTVKSVIGHLNAKHTGHIFTAEDNEKTHTKKHANSISVSPSLSKTAAQTRSLQCHECAYNTQHVYLLKRHLRNIHKTSHTVTDVLQMAYNDGILEAGYHCEWCVFSHKEAAGVHQHYHSDECDEMSPAQPSGKNEIKAYPCRACSFKGSSLHSLAGHYRAVHPWSVKEDGSVLDVIASKPGVNKQAQDTEDHNEVSEPFDSYQVPLEFDTLTSVSPQKAAAASSKMIACRLCDASFYNRHGLHTHYGKKHPDSEFPSLDDEQEVSVDTSENITGLQVLKCPRCTYVNTRKHGILAHCQMRHPAFTVRAKKLETDEVQLHDMDSHILTNGPVDQLKFAGFMCKICPVACISLKKLKTHYEQDHNQTAANILKPAPKQSAIIKNQLLSKYHSTQGSVLQGPFFKNRKYSKIKCHFCKYVCSTKIALSRHVCIHQRNAKIQKNAGDQNALYKCSLCSYASSIKKYLAKHYTRTHGKAAFLKYYAPVYQVIFRKVQPASEDAPITQQAEDTPEACPSNNLTTGNKTLIYRCPRCTYVNTSYHGTLTHCQMMHPNLTARADNLATVEIQVSNMDICVKRKGAGDKSRFSGYLCKICQVVRASMKKLKIHYEKDHNQTVPNNLKSASKHPAVIKKQLLSKYHGTQGPAFQSAFFKNKKYAVVKCSFCKYVTTTEIALSRHVHIHHKKAPEAGHQDTLYKCCLCPYSSPIRYYLSKHYSRTHGKAAFLKYYVPVYQKVFRKSKFIPEGGPIIKHAKDSPENCQSVTQSEAPLYKCHLCIYSSPYPRYLSSHYKKSHGYAAYKPELSTKCGDKTFSHVESEESASLKCKKCPELFFNTSQTLSLHYTRFHSRDLKVDFTVLPRTLTKGSKVYKCGHCNVKISSTGELYCHLDHHRELYKKKANALKTKTPPYIKESPEAQCIKVSHMHRSLLLISMALCYMILLYFDHLPCLCIFSAQNSG
uniref:C2H2-type domain-containing protein n=1 Tax=Myripristis murdjan TaxID=586833 RepID=A0A667XWW2_9TELE